MSDKVDFLTKELEDLAVPSLVIEVHSSCAELKSQSVDGRCWQLQGGEDRIDNLHDWVPEARGDLESDQVLKSL